MINNMRLRGDTIPTIAGNLDLSVPTIDRIVSTTDSKDYRQSTIESRHSRNSQGNSARVSTMMTTIIDALETELDHAVTTADRLALSSRVSELYRIIGTPADTGAGSGPPPIVQVPSTMPLDDFNSLHTTGSGPHKEGHSPQSPPVTPGGSEMPPPISLQENQDEPERTALDNEMDPEFRDVYKEIEAGLMDVES